RAGGAGEYLRHKTARSRIVREVRVMEAVPRHRDPISPLDWLEGVRFPGAQTTSGRLGWGGLEAGRCCAGAALGLGQPAPTPPPPGSPSSSGLPGTWTCGTRG